MRSANTVVAENDFGVTYFTSSKEVKEKFNEYDWIIFAYFQTHTDAFLFENSKIKEEWKNPLLLNKHYQLTASEFSMAGFKRPDVGEFNRRTKTKEIVLRYYVCPVCGELFGRELYITNKRKVVACSRKCCGSITGKTPGKVGIPNNKNKGKTAWNKGVKSDTAAENGRKGASALSKKATGRKRKYLPDGTWTWEYPKLAEVIG